MLRKSKIIVAVLLVVLISISTFTVALASNDTPVEQSLTKIFRMPQGTDTPEAKFEFEVKLVSVDDNTNPPQSSVPTFENIVINIEAETVGEAPGANNREARGVHENIFANASFPHAGVYIFEISEVHNTNPELDSASSQNELIYSNVVYKLQVQVANSSTPGGTYVALVGMIAGAKDENGNAVFGTEKAEQLIFTNDFVRTNGPLDPNNPKPGTESTLNVSKTVTGELGRRDQYFNFSMTLNVPALMGEQAPARYKAYFVDENGAVITDITENAADSETGADNGGPFIWVSVDDTTNYNLLHGQKLVFVDTPVGTSYTVTEAKADNYKTNFSITTNNRTEGPFEGNETGTQFVGELKNSADFTNDRPFTAPMGLSLNDLPFVGLILLAIAALVTFVVVKVRKQRKYF